MWAINAALNPESIVFGPGGIWEDKFLIPGEFETIYYQGFSKALMQDFIAAFSKTFTRHSDYLVGPEALLLCRTGALRLVTRAVEEPPESNFNP